MKLDAVLKSDYTWQVSFQIGRAINGTSSEDLANLDIAANVEAMDNCQRQ